MITNTPQNPILLIKSPTTLNHSCTETLNPKPSKKKENLNLLDVVDSRRAEPALEQKQGEIILSPWWYRGSFKGEGFRV